MDIVLLGLRLTVAAVFGVAGVAKLLDRAGAISAVEAFGLPRWLARPFGTMLPIAELTIAVALIPAATAPSAGVAAALLMGVFVVGISVNLARGKRPDCHCFGTLHSAPIGWQTVARTVAIALGAALIAIAGPGRSLASAVQSLNATSWVLLVLLAGMSVVAFLQQRSLSALSNVATVLEARFDTMQRAFDGKEDEAPVLSPGRVAPPFALNAIGKGTISLAQLTALGKPLFLVFAEPGCSACNRIMPSIGRYARELKDVLTVAVITSGGEEANRRKVERFGLDWVLLPENRDLVLAYRVPGAPAGVMIGPNGLVTAPLVYGPEQVVAALENFAAASLGPAAVAA